MKTTNVNLVPFLLVLSLSSSLLFGTNSAVTGVTNTSDALAIQLIQDTFSIFESEDDPCLPEPYSWVTCSSDDTPRITEINLHGSTIFGDLPDFSDMDALEKIDLGDNILLGGEFPDFLANLPKLQVLYLVGTSFTGTVPTSLKERADKKTLTLMLSGLGTNLCYSDEDVCPVEKKTKGTGTSPATETGTSPDTETGTSPGTNDEGTSDSTATTSSTPAAKSQKNNTTPIVVGTLVPIFVIFGAFVGFLAVRHQKRKAAAVAGLMNMTSGPAMPMNGNTMSPDRLLRGENFQDLESAAQNVLPDDEGVDIGAKGY